MAEVQKATDGWTLAMRWTARALALLVVGLFLWFLVEFGARVLARLPWLDPQGVPLLAALLVALAGVVVAWRWELVGGLMALAGALAIVALVEVGSGLDTLYAALLFTAPLLVAAALYLGCCARKRSSG
jgi:hypothetical protein